MGGNAFLVDKTIQRIATITQIKCNAKRPAKETGWDITQTSAVVF